MEKGSAILKLYEYIHEIFKNTLWHGYTLATRLMAEVFINSNKE